MIPTNVVAIDPGLRPGAVWLQDGAVIRIAARLTGPGTEWIWSTPWDIAATELQWIFPKRPEPKRPGPRRAARPQDILRLAFRAGFTLACVPAARSLAILPQDWRRAIGFGDGLTKEQVQKKIAADLTAAQRQLFSEVAPGRHGDVLDAIGIGRAAVILAPTTTKHDWILGK